MDNSKDSNMALLVSSLVLLPHQVSDTSNLKDKIRRFVYDLIST